MTGGGATAWYSRGVNAIREAISRPAVQVTLLIPAALRMHCDGAERLDVAATTVRDALAVAGHRHPALLQYILTRDGRLRPFVKVFVRQRDVRDLDGLATRLAGGDTVMIVPAVAGG